MGNGELRKFWYVVFPDGRKQTLADRRVVRMDSYYVGKNHDAPKAHMATHMTLELAQQVLEIYKHRNPIIRDDSDHDFGEDPLKSELWQVGEADSPAKPEPGSVGRLEDAVRAAMAELTKQDVLNIVGRILLQ